MMPMTMMPNRSLFNIQSSKITARARARTSAGGDPRVSPAVPFSGEKRGLDLQALGHREGTQRPTEV